MWTIKTLITPAGCPGCSASLRDSKTKCREARWPSGRASDSGARGRGFDPHSGHRKIVSLSKI